MTVAFYKLHVCGDDFLLVDRTKPAHENLLARPELLGDLSRAILDRRRGVGASAIIFTGSPALSKTPGPRDTLPVRIFRPDGSENYKGGDQYLCIARWAFDTGQLAGTRIRISTPSGDRLISVVDSRSFSLEMPPPRSLDDGDREVGHGSARDARLDLVLDGISATAWLVGFGRPYAVVIRTDPEPKIRRLRAALSVAVPDACVVVLSSAGRDLVRFIAPESADRAEASAAALVAAILSGRTDDEAAAEWRGRGPAAAFADFGAPGKKNPVSIDSGPAVLIDRGRFYADWKRRDRILVTGNAEYAFEGKFDY
jgi:diaminopimelate epimerase